MSTDNNEKVENYNVISDKCTECAECYEFGTKGTGELVCTLGNHYRILDALKPCKSFKFRWPC